MKKLIILLIITALAVSGCGYRMAGLGGESLQKFKLASVINNSDEPDVRDDLKNVSGVYLAQRGALSEDANTPKLRLELVSVSSSKGVVTDTGKAETANLTARMKVSVSENGKTVFEKTYKTFYPYKTGTDVYTTKAQWRAAFHKAVKDLLGDFLNDFRPQK